MVPSPIEGRSDSNQVGRWVELSFTGRPYHKDLLNVLQGKEINGMNLRNLGEWSIDQLRFYFWDDVSRVADLIVFPNEIFQLQVFNSPFFPH